MSRLSKTECKLTEYAAEAMVYFERHKLIEIAKKILVECALHRPLDPTEWIGKNIKRIASEVYNDCLNQGENGILKGLKMTKHFLYRIVMFGRPGSGRKTQAHNLVATFNLVLIDAEMLIYQYLQGSEERAYDPLAFELQRAFYHDNCSEKSKALLNIIARRVLEKDCLNRGWILLNFTHTLQDFKNIFENFKIPPNKLVYLKCSERIGMQRILNMPSLGKPSQTYTYYEHEMRFFNHHETEITEYLLKRHETIFVDGAQCSEDVKTQLMSSVTKYPYVMGYKQNVC